MLPAGQALEVAEGLWAARNIYYYTVILNAHTYFGLIG